MRVAVDVSRSVALLMLVTACSCRGLTHQQSNEYDDIKRKPQELIQSNMTRSTEQDEQDGTFLHQTISKRASGPMYQYEFTKLGSFKKHPVYNQWTFGFPSSIRLSSLAPGRFPFDVALLSSPGKKVSRPYYDSIFKSILEVCKEKLKTTEGFACFHIKMQEYYTLLQKTAYANGATTYFKTQFPFDSEQLSAIAIYTYCVRIGNVVKLEAPFRQGIICPTGCYSRAGGRTGARNRCAELANTASGKCHKTGSWVYQGDFKCDCQTGFSWDTSNQFCRRGTTQSASPVRPPAKTPANTPAKTPAKTPAPKPQPSSNTEIYPFEFIKFESFKKHPNFNKWVFGFPRGTTLASLAPGKFPYGIRYPGSSTVVHQQPTYESIFKSILQNCEADLSTSQGFSCFNENMKEYYTAMQKAAIQSKAPTFFKNDFSFDSEQLSVIAIFTYCSHIGTNVKLDGPYRLKIICPTGCYNRQFGREGKITRCKELSNTASGICHKTGSWVYEGDFKCDCIKGYNWDPSKSICTNKKVTIPKSGSTFEESDIGDPDSGEIINQDGEVRNEEEEEEGKKGNLIAGMPITMVIGIAIGVVLFIALIICICMRMRGKSKTPTEAAEAGLPTGENKDPEWLKKYDERNMRPSPRRPPRRNRPAESSKDRHRGQRSNKRAKAKKKEKKKLLSSSSESSSDS